MEHFFPQADDLPINNSLLLAESYFGAQKASGLIEKQVNADRTVVLLVVCGSPSWAYAVENNKSMPVPLTEFSSLAEDAGSLRAIKLPDVAGRLIWLMLESQTRNKYLVNGESAWKDQLSQWKQDQWNGLVEIKAETLHGFLHFWLGELQEPEIIFSTPQGFINHFPQAKNMGAAVWEVTAYAPITSTQAYQCAILRQGAVHWSYEILSHYKEIVGQKLLQLMDRELNRQITPWQWNIALKENVMVDTHFFSHLSDAAQAYRALFMEMGVQMDFVIGSNLTQRILSETFGQIHPDERAVLQSQRLIPAAISK